MDAVELLKAAEELCTVKCYGCYECPLGKRNNGMSMSCGDLKREDPQRYVELVEKWWEDNKPITNAEWVKKKLEEIGYHVEISELKHNCPVQLDDAYTTRVTNCMGLIHCNECTKWWDEEHKEVTE